MDLTYLILKELKKALGMMIKSKYDNAEVQRVSTSLFGDTNFSTKWIDCGSAMQEVLDYFSSMHKAAGGKVQKEKFMMHSCKWESSDAVEVLRWQHMEMLLKGLVLITLWNH